MLLDIIMEPERVCTSPTETADHTTPSPASKGGAHPGHEMTQGKNT